MRAKRGTRSASALALALWAVPALCSAQGAYLRIKVTDAVTLQPIYGAAVNFPELRLYSLTNVLGEAVVSGIPPGNHAIEVTMLGYGVGSAEIHLDPGAIGRGEVQLKSEPIAIEGIVVNGKRFYSGYLDRTGYYERSRAGMGYHLEREDIEKSFAQSPSELLRRVPISSIEDGRCPWTLWIDGVRTGKGQLDDQLISWIEGIEIFPRRVEVPVEYIRPDTCRTILVWTADPRR